MAELMRLLRCSDTGDFGLPEAFVSHKTIPPYAILSHTWEEDQEITFEDLADGTGKDKTGYDKIRHCSRQAKCDGLQYFWVDTCCIDKSNPAELQKAINSMFRWYRNARKCYVYLQDVSTVERKAIDKTLKYTWEPAFRQSRWFKRGWTLQELIAPASVEFFSREWQRLGDKHLLTQQIREVTVIPETALQGTAMFRFSAEERFSWIQSRETTEKEDKAYALLGIFDIKMPLCYGEGYATAFKRLQEEISKLKTCLQDLHSTDPLKDKRRIEDTKGGLLLDSYRWILEHPDYQQWQGESQSRLLWIKGDPGKGKTMLLCGIINELEKSTAETSLLSYFFCQATDSRINSATAVLRGLLFTLVRQQPSLFLHMREQYDQAGKSLFEDANAWVSLSEIFTSIVQDPSLKITYLILDALDECITDLPKLLDFIVQTSSASSRVKWIMSSRNWPNIQERLERAEDKVRLSLELNAESVSAAVRLYINYKVSQLARDKKYSHQTIQAVLDYIHTNANDTFLWAALVCQNLSKLSRVDIVTKLKAFPPGLDSLYERMEQNINDSGDAGLCRQALGIVSTVYRPITLHELASLMKELDDMDEDSDSAQDIISLCGSLLTVRDGTIYFVHQSAKDFLLKETSNTIFPSGGEVVHYAIFSRSLLAMSNTLRRDLYRLGALGYPIEQIHQPDPDPLVASRYSCIYWVDHLCDSILGSATNNRESFQDENIVDVFLRKKYLYWLEALSLCQSVSKGVVSMAKLAALVQSRRNAQSLVELVQDAYRFIMYFKVAIESAPLQAYTSGLLFSPKRSLAKTLFQEEAPKWIKIASSVTDDWSACLQTLEGHSSSVNSVAFSPDSQRLASASHDDTVKIWDSTSGKCLQTLEGHNSWVNSVAFSPDSQRLASASYDKTVKIWDSTSGKYLQTLEGHSGVVWSVAFSPDSQRLASASSDKTVKIWDSTSGKCLQTLKGHSYWVESVAFSPDSQRLASASYDITVKIWDPTSGKCLQTLEGHSDAVNSVAFSPDSQRLASASNDKTVKIWDPTSGKCLQTLEGHSGAVNSVAFSPDSQRLASASFDKTVKIWDPTSDKCLQTLEGHSSLVNSVAFSPDSQRLASGSSGNTVKIWDPKSGKYFQTLEGHSGYVNSVAFSSDSQRLASASYDNTVKIWDPTSGKCLQTLEGHSSSVNSMAFSPDSQRVASASHDDTVKIWDSTSGKCLQTLEGHGGSVWSVAFSPDSQRLASASHDKTVKIWDPTSGKCLQTLEGHSGSVNSVAFSPDSQRLASASNDNTVKIWDPTSGKCLQTISVDTSLRRIAFNADGSSLYTHIGTIAINAPMALSSSNMTDITIAEQAQFQGVALSSDNVWITYNSRNIVWLPPDYRPSVSAVSSTRIGIGVGTGRVWIFNVQSQE